ncbi:hypothetical protein BJ878DRAFT_483615 [Calycina marina]|uniref:Uncharacterized protein n=1 Tax=Calycina marina TaxID=1763456 RepID=A0A9P7YX34_9HELO|nr:hypothetical protein BJ878DRAFT_483615 [Calycina marina]
MQLYHHRYHARRRADNTQRAYGIPEAIEVIGTIGLLYMLWSQERLEKPEKLKDTRSRSSPRVRSTSEGCTPWWSKGGLRTRTPLDNPEPYGSEPKKLEPHKSGSANKHQQLDQRHCQTNVLERWSVEGLEAKDAAAERGVTNIDAREIVRPSRRGGIGSYRDLELAASGVAFGVTLAITKSMMLG